MRLSAIVLAAGKGLRFRLGVSKPLVKINKKPIIIHSLSTLNHHPQVRDIVVVVNSKNSKDIAKAIRGFRINKVVKIVFGGKRRQDSSLRGLEALDEFCDFVLIHDAARPFVDKEALSSVINAAGKNGAAILGVPVKATIKEIQSSKFKVQSKNLIKKTLDRERLWEAQTPQVFKKDLLLKAYKRFGHLDATDDSILIEKLGTKVSVVRGSYNNIKITTQEDLIIAKAIAKTLMSNDKIQSTK